MKKFACGAIAAACLLVTPATAYDPPYVWVGQLILTEMVNCGGGGSDTVSMVFRPKLQEGEDNSAFSYSFLYASGTARKSDSSLQFNGTGKYESSFVTGFVTTRTTTGKFDLKVRPALISPKTKFITLSGTLTNFVGVDGCDVTVRGTAVRR
jgi:hypothetical protein